VAKHRRVTINLRKSVLDCEPVADYWRPTTRGDCLPGGLNCARPCPFVGCRFHLYLDVRPNGNIRLNFPSLDPEQLADSCALDVADEGGATLLRVGDSIGVTREMIRQMEAVILAKLPRTEDGDLGEPGDPVWLPAGAAGELAAGRSSDPLAPPGASAEAIRRAMAERVEHNRQERQKLRLAVREMVQREGALYSVEASKRLGIPLGKARSLLVTLEQLGELVSTLEPSPGSGLGRRVFRLPEVAE